MARARNIKPGFWTNEHVVELGPWARLLFIGLWAVADREGRLEDRPKRIKMEVFPADVVDVDALLTEIAGHGLIRRYSVHGANLIWIPGFREHQNPHRNEKSSELPAHPEDNIATLPEHSRNAPTDPAESLNLNPDSLKPDTGDVARVNALDGADAPPQTQTVSEPEPIPPKPKRADRAQRIPTDFVPSAGLRSWAGTELALDPATIDRETAKFCDHFRGSGATKLDWPATWRNWMRNASEGKYSRPVTTGPPRNPPPPERRPAAKTDEEFESRVAEFFQSGSRGAP
jgi:hypothetical protein